MKGVVTLVTVVSLSVAGIVACSGAKEPESPGAFVVDRAGLIGAESRARMDDLSRALLEDADVELVALSVPSLEGESIDGFARGRFETLEIGRRTRGGRGMLLVVAEEEERVRLEVGYALEGLFTDAFLGYVEREQMVPYFAEGRVGEGIEATVELIAGRAFERIRAAGYDPSREEPATIGGFAGGGAGVRTEVSFGDSSEPGEKPPVVAPAERGYFSAQPTPELAWERFLETNRRRVKDPGLGIYDESARRIMRERPVTNAGQDHIARLYGDADPTLRVRDDRAVVLFPRDTTHTLAPWFFRRTPEGWRLDGDASRDLVAYNHRNQWHFRRTDHDWMFAFEGYRFDAHGFGFPPR